MNIYDKNHLLQQAVASGQVSAAQIEKHQAAGELGKPFALQMPPVPDHDKSWVNGKDEKGNLTYGVAHSDASLQNYAQAYAEPLRFELEAAKAAQLIEVSHLKRLLFRYRNEIPAGHQPHMICHEVDAALSNTKEHNK